MQREPAWLSLLADFKLQDFKLDWPGGVPPPTHHQDLVYLTSEKALRDESAQTIHSFYSFILVRQGTQHPR